MIQLFISNRQIHAIHDRSDGGLITTIAEMCMSSNIGANINIVKRDVELYNYFFSEELGLVVEGSFERINAVIGRIVPVHKIGVTTDTPSLSITYNTIDICNIDIREMRSVWEDTSFIIVRRNTDLDCIREEMMYVTEMEHVEYKAPFS